MATEQAKQATGRWRLAVHGPNTLPAAAPRSSLLRFLAQFNDALRTYFAGFAFSTSIDWICVKPAIRGRRHEDHFPRRCARSHRLVLSR